MHSDSGRDRRGHELGLADARKRDEEHSACELVDELGADLQRHPRLPRATGARHRHEPGRTGQQILQLGHFPLAPDQRIPSDRKVGGVQTLQRRKVAFAKLVDPLRCSQIFEAVLAEVPQFVAVGEVASRLRDEHLPPVARSRDPGRSMDIDSDVTLLGHDRLASVQAHANTDRTAGKRVPPC